jgi:AcrR family transcriptional regulator
MLKIPHDTRVFTSTDRRRRAILDASLDLICQGGPDAITYRAVAARAKVPPGSVTYYFASREALVREAFRHYLIEAQAWLTATTREQRPSAAEINAAEVVRFVVETVRLELTDPRITRADYDQRARRIERATRRPASRCTRQPGGAAVRRAAVV